MNSDLAITNMRGVDDVVIAEIDAKRATYQGRRWLTLSGYEKRKFENLVVLSRPMDRVKIIYY